MHHLSFIPVSVWASCLKNSVPPIIFL
jgi:hypothetical protein